MALRWLYHVDDLWCDNEGSAGVCCLICVHEGSAVRRSAWCERVGEAKVKVKACAVGELNPDLILGRDES